MEFMTAHAAAAGAAGLSVVAHLYVSCLTGAATRIITAEGVSGGASWQVVDEGTDINTLYVTSRITVGAGAATTSVVGL